MALLNNSDTDYIQADSNRTDSPSALTYLFWIKLNTIQESYFYRSGGGERQLSFTWADTDNLEFTVFRVTQNSTYRSTDFAAATGNWYFVAFVYNEDNTVWGGSQAMEFARGTLTTKATQLSTSQILAGSGGTTGLSNDTVYLTNRDSIDDRRLDGDIAFYAGFESELSLAEIQSIQFNPWMAINYSPVTLLFPGLQGASTVIDYSGNGDHFTATNMTVSPGVPVQIIPQYQTWMPYEVSATGDLSGQATLSTSATVTAVGAVELGAQSQIDGSVTLSADGSQTLISASTLGGVSTVTADGSQILISASVLDGVSTTTADAAISFGAFSTLDSTATITALPTFLHQAQSTITATASLISDGSIILVSASTLDSLVTVTAVGTVSISGKLIPILNPIRVQIPVRKLNI